MNIEPYSYSRERRQLHERMGKKLLCWRVLAVLAALFGGGWVVGCFGLRQHSQHRAGRPFTLFLMLLIMFAPFFMDTVFEIE